MRRAMLWLLVAVCAGLAAPVRAEITWIDAAGGYELSGAQLFRLRGELPPFAIEELNAVRNVPFPDEASFRAAVDAALMGVALRQEWVDQLTALAARSGAAFGLEPREGGMLTVIVSNTGHALDANPFTAQSWLTALPEPADSSPVTGTMDEGCLDVSEGNVLLFSLCAPNATDDGTSAVLKTTAETVRGLGQEFLEGRGLVADRIGTIRHGLNVMSGFNGGANGNTLFPIAYFDHPERPFALILDNRYQQEWDFSADDFRLRVWGGDFRLHVLTGATLADIRRSYLQITGTPPVPPKAAFGLWNSEYGYENWAEVEDKIASLRQNGFPLSGIVLDLFWFGGISPSSPTSRMGSLTWDETRFPNPAAKLRQLRAEGIETMLIEESYISSGLPEFTALEVVGGLAHDASGAPLLVNPAGNWWGKGGMIDHTTAAVRDFWHDHRRQALVDMGVLGHWTDLGEPEMVNPGFTYDGGLSQAQVHNSYNRLWLQGIFDGISRNSPERRPWMMSRSGGIGMQALGAAMWSGDTGGDFASLEAQMPQQTHMMWSGLDYYGSDIGGFHRSALGVYRGTREEAMDDLYTQWFAYSAMFEVPVRPHTENLCNCKETAPDRIGDMASNLANLRLRHALLPYYYSLAHAAWRDGEPVFPSVDYWFPEATEARELGHVKMIGSQLLAAAVAARGATEVEIYLPEGTWYDFHTGAAVVGGTMRTAPVYAGDLLQLPLYARDGAVVPSDGAMLNVFGTGENRFDWYDDDGYTNAYLVGEFEQISVTVGAQGIAIERINGAALMPQMLRWVLPEGSEVGKVLVDGAETAFERDGSAIVVTLPPLAERMTVAIEG